LTDGNLEINLIRTALILFFKCIPEWFHGLLCLEKVRGLGFFRQSQSTLVYPNPENSVIKNKDLALTISQMHFFGMHF
jgi:hypothetical protein